MINRHSHCIIFKAFLKVILKSCETKKSLLFLPEFIRKATVRIKTKKQAPFAEKLEEI